VSKKKKISDIYEVGYGKPPNNTQFQKGISGNPAGRPKKAPDFYAELIQEANSIITINDKGRRIRITKTHGMAKQLTNQVVTGNIRATRILLSFTNKRSKGSVCQQFNNLKRSKDAMTLRT